MKIHLVRMKNPERDARYTHIVIEQQIRKYGFQLVPPNEAELFLCSICDTDDLPKLKMARKIAGDKPLVMGGYEAFSGGSYLAYADYLWIGEGFEFFKSLANDGWDKTRVHESMFSKDKPEAIPSTWIDWQNVPIGQTGANLYYVLMARGCHNKCKFCGVAWANKHQIAPDGYQRAVSHAVARY